jgi:tRNA dimethylallyltransferase
MRNPHEIPRLSVHLGAIPPVVLVGGATASGKSAMALEMARTADGEIVNADSMQIYADLRVLTARPSDEQEAAAPHHLFGVADGAEVWSVGRWLRAAQSVLAEIAERGRPAIVVGGTGLYLRALTQGLADIPPVPAEIRAEIHARFDHLGEDAFRLELAKIDPAAAARIAPGDRQRLTRALEVHAATDKPLSQWQGEAGAISVSSNWRGLVIEPPRQELYRRCDARLVAMVRNGALDEVRRLMARDLAPTNPILKALGVAPFAAHLRGELTVAQALVQAQTDTRRYAKRQLTWFRHQTPDWERIST